MSDAAKAFIKAQSEMGKAIKNAANPHLKSKYADLGSVMDAALPALHANGFGLMQPAGADDRGQYVDTVLLHEGGERFVSRVYLIMGKQDMQALGSAQTYARRYGLLGMAGLAPEDDDGEATKAPTRQQQPRQPTQDNSPAFNARAEADRIIANLRAQASINDMADAWRAETAARKSVFEADEKLHEEIVAAKDARKTELELNDSVPF